MRRLVVLSLLVLATPAAGQQAGDANRGAQIYENRCTGCHSLDANRVGPAHRGVFGRRVGTAPDFDYSPALRRSRVVWDERTLDQWLRGPNQFIPGNQMGFSLGNAQERADVIAFLRRESGR
jgi:cytochrome c